MKSARLLGFVVALSLLSASARETAGEGVDNVVIVLDSSGSMNEQMPRTRQQKISAAKVALKEVVGQLPPTTHVGLLVFGGRGIREPWVYPLGPRDDSRLLAAINALRADGGTPLGAYIKKAADRLLEERAKQFGYGTFRLLIVSDGEAQDQDLVERYTPEVMARGITVDVIGVAMAQQHSLATKVHSYRSANDPESLRQALREVFAEVPDSASDEAYADAFATLDPIPAEMATAVLQALSAAVDHPIGERPSASPARRTGTDLQADVATEAQRTSGTGPAATESPPSATTSASGPPTPGPPVAAPTTRSVVGFAWGGLLCFGAACVVLVFAARGLARSARRRR